MSNQICEMVYDSSVDASAFNWGNELDVLSKLILHVGEHVLCDHITMERCGNDYLILLITH